MGKKSTEAQLRAAKKYSEKVDRVSVLLPKRTKDKIRDVSEGGVSQYISELVERDLRRHNKSVVAGVRARIEKDMKSCKTVEDWHDAFGKLFGDFKDCVEGERMFEEYVVKVLGNEALQKFLSNVSAPLFGDEVIKHMSAVNDFFDPVKPWCETPIPELTDLLNSPEYIAEEHFKHLAHLYTATVLRCEQVESSITRLLGADAFERLSSCGSYERDHLYYAALEATNNSAKKQKLFIDWLAGRGMFAEEAEEKPLDIRADGWTPVNEPPQETTPALMLLSDGCAVPGVYLDGKWTCANQDYSSLVIGWKAFVKEDPRPKEIRDAYSRLNVSIADGQDEVLHDVRESVFNAYGASSMDDVLRSVNAFACVSAVVDFMGHTGACRPAQIWRSVCDAMSDSPEAIIPFKDIFRLCSAVGVIRGIGSKENSPLLALTDNGLIFFDAMHDEAEDKRFTPNVAIVDGKIDCEEFLHQKRIESVEKIFDDAGYCLINEEGVDVVACKNGEKIRALCLSSGTDEIPLNLPPVVFGIESQRKSFADIDGVLFVEYKDIPSWLKSMG